MQLTMFFCPYDPVKGISCNEQSWEDWRRHAHPAATTASNLASDKPIDETYHGRYAFSEPETRNVAWVLDQFPRIRWYMDIHSAVGDILFNWGDDNDQLNDPSMQFLNPAWDGKRGSFVWQRQMQACEVRKLRTFYNDSRIDNRYGRFAPRA